MVAFICYLDAHKGDPKCHAVAAVLEWAVVSDCPLVVNCRVAANGRAKGHSQGPRDIASSNLADF